MPASFSTFLAQAVENPALALSVLLTLGVLLVNGWTDAPNAIAGAVVTGALSFRRAVLLAAVCNFLGVLCVTSVYPSVAETIYSIASFGGGPEAASLALCAAMGAVVLWAAAAWRWGIPTSESHALVAGVSGAAAALEGNLSCIRWQKWGLVLLGLVLSTALGFWAGRWAEGATRGWGWSGRAYRVLQIPGAAGTAFLHGAQDGQKFLGVFLLGAALAQGRQGEGMARAPLWLMVLCAAFMALGTGVGGRRIIDTVGRDMVSLGPREGFSADARVHHPHPHRRPAGGGLGRGEAGGLGGGPVRRPGLAVHLPRVHGAGLAAGEGDAGNLNRDATGASLFLKGLAEETPEFVIILQFFLSQK